MILKKIFNKQEEQVKKTDKVQQTEDNRSEDQKTEGDILSKDSKSQNYKPVSTKTKRQKRVGFLPTQKRKTSVHTSEVIIKPHVTEKSSVMSESNIYTFIVKKQSSAFDVCAAVKEMYGADVSCVRFAKKGPKKISQRKQGNKNPGQKNAMKKAYVKVKKGSKIKLS